MSVEKKTGKLLIVDDNEDLLRAARIFLKRHFLHVDTSASPDHLPDLVTNEQYDVILLDMNFTRDKSSGEEGFYWLDRILAIDPGAVVILITAYGDVQLAVKAIKEGATDFVVKPWDNDKLLATLFSARRLRQSLSEVARLKEQQQVMAEAIDNRYQDIIGQSPAMKQVFNTIEQVAGTDANVLILGENGTGKELVARAIHRKSRRAKQAFISVDLGAVSETLFESELFGHVKGAFTDARDSRAGRFELASGGTLFLDEIGNLSMPLQAKLLTALQSRVISRVGSAKAVPVDIRLISATNMPLPDMIAEKQFRQDLLYRINTIELTLPPLRERREDISLLASHFLQHYARKYNKETHSISPAAVKRMEKYPWPGNVRELQHAMERAVIMSNQKVLQPEDLLLSTRTHDNVPEDALVLEEFNMEKVEKLLIQKVLKKHNGNVTHAAQELGLTRSSLYRRLERYGL